MAASLPTTLAKSPDLRLVTDYLQHTLPSGHQNQKKLIHLLAPTVQIEVACDKKAVFSFKGKRKTLEDVDPLFSSIVDMSISILKINADAQCTVVKIGSLILNNDEQRERVLDVVELKYTTIKTKLKIQKIVHHRITNNFQKDPSTKPTSSNAMEREPETPEKLLSILASKEISQWSVPASFQRFHLPLRYITAYQKGDLFSMKNLLTSDALIHLGTGLIGHKEFKIESFDQEITAFNADIKIETTKIKFVYAEEPAPLILRIKNISSSENRMDLQYLLFGEQENKIDRLGHIRNNTKSFVSFILPTK